MASGGELKRDFRSKVGAKREVSMKPSRVKSATASRQHGGEDSVSEDEPTLKPDSSKTSTKPKALHDLSKSSTNSISGESQSDQPEEEIGEEQSMDKGDVHDSVDLQRSTSPSSPATFDQDEPQFLSSKKKHTPGIVYLSYIPEGLTVADTRELLSAFGNVGRIYFEPVKRLDKKTRPHHRFTEGWVEFEKKKVAKRVAETLNAKPVGGRRRAPYHDALWSIKYLHRFRWPHLTERLAYEKAVKDQRLRTEIAQAKREASYYAKALERSIRLRKMRNRQAKDGKSADRMGVSEVASPRMNVRLKKTDKEIRQEKKEGSAVDKSLLMSIFSK